MLKYESLCVYVQHDTSSPLLAGGVAADLPWVVKVRRVQVCLSFSLNVAVIYLLCSFPCFISFFLKLIEALSLLLSSFKMSSK